MGSVEGGTVLTINGAGFDPDPDLVEVDVDGVPCDVLSSTLNQIVCRTGKPPANHPSIADYDYAYTDVADGYRFKGVKIFKEYFAFVCCMHHTVCAVLSVLCALHCMCVLIVL